MSGVGNFSGFNGFGGYGGQSNPWDRTNIQQIPGATQDNPTARPDFYGTGRFNEMAYHNTPFGTMQNPYGSFFGGGGYGFNAPFTGGTYSQPLQPQQQQYPTMGYGWQQGMQPPFSRPSFGPFGGYGRNPYGNFRGFGSRTFGGFRY